MTIPLFDPHIVTALRGKVLVITGSGVSAESGIPTFRGADGHWRRMRPEDLATERAFRRDPALVWEWYRERRANVRAAQPNAAHLALAELASQAGEFLLVTQNVDDLHERAGTRENDLVHIHGRLFVDRCLACDYETTELARSGVPTCPECGELLRPGVVWFGEMLDSNEIARVESFLEDGPCTAALVIGTTAVFGYIRDWAVRAAGAHAIIEVNPEATELSPVAQEAIRQPASIAIPELVRAAFPLSPQGRSHGSRGSQLR
jgi:NAD-dependent deacetylase